MALPETIKNLIAAETSLTNVISGRHFYLRAPQNTTPPYVVISTPSHKIPFHLRGATDLQNPIVRFDLFGKNFLQLNTLRDDIVSMMDQQLQAIYIFGTEFYEDDTQLYHLVADFSVWHSRS